MKKERNLWGIALTLVSMNLLFACSNDTSTTNETKSSTSIKEMTNLINEKVTYNDDDFYTDWKKENPTYIKLNGNEAKYEASSAIIFDDNILTIKTGGVYVLSGQLIDGQIVIDAEDKSTVRLVLNGVEITNSNSSAIYVMQAEKTIISIVEGTENRITDGENYVFKDSDNDEPNAAIFSKDDLTINGDGQLIVTGQYNNGITSKDVLKITGGDIQIYAADDGLMGRDLVAVKEGTINIEAGGDGIKSTNDKDSFKGNIALEGGKFDIVAGNDGIQAIASLVIADGAYNITAGGGSPETIKINNGTMGMGGPTNTMTATNTSETESNSAKGLKAATELIVGGGTYAIDTLDDALHSNDKVTIVGGEFTIATGDDGIHADNSIVTTGGTIHITKSYEGIESKLITFEDGQIHVSASDDGINVGGGNDGSGMDMHAVAEDSMLEIHGGYVYVDAAGDGLDSNGSIEMTGGTVIVNGPTDNGNGSLDYDGSFTMSGGFIIAAGSSGMVQASSGQSTQNSILMMYPETQKAGMILRLEDKEVNEIVTFAPTKDYEAVFISSPKLTKDTSYLLFSGGKSTAKEVDGLYKEGDYQGGTKVVEFTITDKVTWLNEAGVTEARSGGFGGGPGGGRPGDGGPGGPGEGGEFPPPSGNQTPPQGENLGDMFGDLDEETKQKIEAIMEQERAGTISREEAQKQLAELGIEFSGRGNRP